MGIFGKPAAVPAPPPPPEAPPAPTPVSAEVVRSVGRQREKARRDASRAGNVKTSAQGLPSLLSTETSNKTLLGA